MARAVQPDRRRHPSRLTYRTHLVGLAAQDVHRYLHLQVVDHQPALLVQIATFADKTAALHWEPSTTSLRRAARRKVRRLLPRRQWSVRGNGAIERVRGAEMTSAKVTKSHERREIAADGTGASASPAPSGMAHIAARGATENAAATIGGKMIASATARERSDHANLRISHTETRSAPDVEAAPPGDWLTHVAHFFFSFLLWCGVYFKAICMHSDGVCLGSLGDTRLEIWRHSWRLGTFGYPLGSIDALSDGSSSYM